MCAQRTCDISGPNGACTECVVDLLEEFYSRNVTVEELLTESFVKTAMRNGTLPFGSNLHTLNGEKAILLPESFSRQCNDSVTCPRLVIINQTLELEYVIQGKLTLQTH